MGCSTRSEATPLSQLGKRQSAIPAASKVDLVGAQRAEAGGDDDRGYNGGRTLQNVDENSQQGREQRVEHRERCEGRPAIAGVSPCSHEPLRARGCRDRAAGCPMRGRREGDPVSDGSRASCCRVRRAPRCAWSPPRTLVRSAQERPNARLPTVGRNHSQPGFDRRRPPRGAQQAGAPCHASLQAAPRGRVAALALATRCTRSAAARRHKHKRDPRAARTSAWTRRSRPRRRVSNSSPSGTRPAARVSEPLDADRDDRRGHSFVPAGERDRTR